MRKRSPKSNPTSANAIPTASPSALYERIRRSGRHVLLAGPGNLAPAFAQFADPLLFGKAGAAPTPRARHSRRFGPASAPWLAAWAGFGLFSIVAGIGVALYADRLAHRRRLGVIAAYFEHVHAPLPMSFHASARSGRLLKVMIEGANGMFGIWRSFFREHCAGFVALVALLPLTLLQ